MDATDVLIWILVAAAAAGVALVRVWRDFTRKRAAALQSVVQDIRKLRRMALVAPRMVPLSEGEPVPEGLDPIMRGMDVAHAVREAARLQARGLDADPNHPVPFRRVGARSCDRRAGWSMRAESGQ